MKRLLLHIRGSRGFSPERFYCNFINSLNINPATNIGIPTIGNPKFNSISSPSAAEERAEQIKRNDADFVRYTEFETPKEHFLRDMMRSDDEWVAQEKVHGANFGIHVLSGGEVKFAKRSMFIRPEEYFFGYTKIAPKLTQQMPIIQQLLEERVRKKVDSFIVFGEIFGGKYTHPAMGQKELFWEFLGKMHRIAPIQTDFFPQYSPDLHFFAFELKYRSLPNGPLITCPIDDSVAVFSGVPDFLYAKPLLRGTLEHCLGFNMDIYQTVVPQLLGLGNFVLPGNFAEGMVLRKAKRGGEESEIPPHSILKFKHRMFQESRHRNKIGERDPLHVLYHEISHRRGETLLDPSSFMSDSEVASLTSLLDMVCENRFQAVISKYGIDVFSPKSDMPESERKGPVELVELIAKDAMKDWLKERSFEELAYTNYVKLMFANYLRNEAEKFVVKVWQNLLARY
ncbi:RNA editing ligase [Perkinsela sp. CCAP 1560/4]|nr:RNA editing ligase [Perkinsela sp. CCAP 1560/4]|eukprot:KNH03941.1 RNA editing ligase [Perkinsela sp. CCAP 1560/4]